MIECVHEAQEKRARKAPNHAPYLGPLPKLRIKRVAEYLQSSITCTNFGAMILLSIEEGTSSLDVFEFALTAFFGPSWAPI